MDRPLNSIDILVGKSLAKLRADRGGTLEALATALNVERRVVLAIEAGRARAPAPLLMRASRYFNVPISTFYE